MNFTECAKLDASEVPAALPATPLFVLLAGERWKVTASTAELIGTGRVAHLVTKPGAPTRGCRLLVCTGCARPVRHLTVPELVCRHCADLRYVSQYGSPDQKLERRAERAAQARRRRPSEKRIEWLRRQRPDDPSTEEAETERAQRLLKRL